MKQIFPSLTLCFLLITCPALAKPAVLFFDDFNSPDSYHSELTRNATSKVYKTNSTLEGHLLKKWNYSWEYQYLEGDWKQAFYIVKPGESVMTQAGRSGSFGGASPYRITANAEIPATVKRYRVEFKQYKHDNDPVLYVLGGNINGQEGVEIGFENQIPGTDESVDDAYLKGNLGEGVIKPGMAYRRSWAEVQIDVNVETKKISWTINSREMLTAYAQNLKPGGYFGLYMRYERDTRFDDVRISVLE